MEQELKIYQWLLTLMYVHSICACFGVRQAGAIDIMSVQNNLYEKISQAARRLHWVQWVSPSGAPIMNHFSLGVL